MVEELRARLVTLLAERGQVAAQRETVWATAAREQRTELTRSEAEFMAGVDECAANLDAEISATEMRIEGILSARGSVESAARALSGVPRW